MRIVRSLVLFAAALGPASAAAGQGQPIASVGQVSGRVLDSASGAPVIRAWACLAQGRMARCAGVDSAGRFAVAGFETGTGTLSVGCQDRRFRLIPVALDSLPVEVIADSDVVVTVRVASGACDRTPIRSARVRLRGHYQGGFEMSELVPCSATDSTLPPELRPALQGRGSIWAVSTNEALRTAGWPQVPEVDGVERWYVEVTGVLRGPDRYGHMGMATYLLDIDSVLVARAPSPGDCDGATRRF